MRTRHTAAALLLLAGTARGAEHWRHDCRAAMHTCRATRAASLVVDCGPPPTTTTTLPAITAQPYPYTVSQNCAPQPSHCWTLTGGPFNYTVLCLPLEVMSDCSLPRLCPSSSP